MCDDVMGTRVHRDSEMLARPNVLDVLGSTIDVRRTRCAVYGVMADNTAYVKVMSVVLFGMP